MSKYDDHEVDTRPRRSVTSGARLTASTRHGLSLKGDVIASKLKRGEAAIVNGIAYTIKEIFWHSKNHGEIIVA